MVSPGASNLRGGLATISGNTTGALVAIWQQEIRESHRRQRPCVTSAGDGLGGDDMVCGDGVVISSMSGHRVLLGPSAGDSTQMQATMVRVRALPRFHKGSMHDDPDPHAATRLRG